MPTPQEQKEQNQPRLNKWHWLLLAVGFLACARSPVLLIYVSAVVLFLYWFYRARSSKNTLAILICLCLALFFITPLLPFTRHLQPLTSLDRWMFIVLTALFAGAVILFYVYRRQYTATLKGSLPAAPVEEAIWEVDEEDDEEDDYNRDFPYQDEDIWEDDDDEEDD